MPETSPPLPAPARRAAIAFIFVTALLDVIALGIIIPVLPRLIEEFAGSPAAAAATNASFMALFALMQFLVSPIVGSLSDRYGRRPVILVSAAGLACDYVLMALAPDLFWLALGRVIAGVTSSSFATAFAYLADVTPPERRARAYGLIGAAFSGGFVAGPLLGGVLGEFSPRLPFWVAGAMSALAFVYGALILPESLPRERRTAFAWKRANPLGALTLLRSHRELTGLASVNFLLYFAHHAFPAVFVLYLGHRYGWTPWQVGALMAGIGVLDMLVQGVIVGRVVARFGDRRTMLAGLAGGALGVAMMGAAPTGELFLLSVIPCAFWGLAMPTLQSLMTRHVSESEQGQLQGANNGLGAIAGIVSPLCFGAIYAQSVGADPWFANSGTALIASGALQFGAALLAARVTRPPTIA